MPVQIARPTSSVSEAFSPLLTTNHALVSDQDNATYVSAFYAPGTEDRYGWPDLPADATAVSSVGFGWTGSSVSGDHEARVKLWLGASTTLGTTRVLTTSAVVWVETALARPGGGSWSVADVNGLDAGVELVGGSAFDGSRVHEMYRFVEYETADTVVRGSAASLPLSRTDADRVSLGRSETARPALSRTASTRIDLDRTSAVDTPLSRTVAVRIDLTEG